MFFTSWLQSFSRRIGLSKYRRGKHLSPKQRQQMLHGVIVVSPHAEALEERCVLTSPNFISVSPNTGVFLSDGSTLTDAPREVTFQFSPGQTLSSATLGAIHVVGAGYDGAFTPANVVTDLGANSAGNTVITGVTGNAAPIVITAPGHGLATGNQVTISGVLGNLNSNGAATITVLTADSFLLNGKTGTGNYTSGGTWALTAGNAVLRIGAQRLGPDDNGSQLDVVIAATGTGPSVTLPSGILTLTLDSVTGTTAQNLIDFLSTDATAKRLLSVSLVGGSPATNLGTGVAGTFQLSGAGAASAVSNFGAGGLQMLFTANQPGLGGNDISLQINRLNLNSDPTPRINVVGKRIEITLNENATAPTTAQMLADAINIDSAASLLVRASIPVGLSATSLSNVTDGTLIRLSSADRALTASALSSFQTNSNLQFQFAAKTQGISGNDISLLFNTGASTSVTVNGKQIIVTLSPTTTASNLITAITSNVAANALISVKLVSGVGTTNISTMANGSLVQLGGADPAVAPGFRGLESNNREVTYRFASPVDNDTYRFEVIGTGTSPLTNVGGEAVDGGQDTFMNVALNLGATVTAVVPQPLLRQQFITVNSVANLVDGDTITIDSGTLENSFAIASSAFGSSGASAATVDFTAVQAGKGGDGIQLIVTKQLLGSNSQTNQPQVIVNGLQISVVLNSTPGSETTALQLINKINSTATAKALVTATLSGVPGSLIGQTASALTTLATRTHLFTFEFNSTGGVRSGNNPITFTSAMTTTQVATAIRDAINSATLAAPDVTATSNLEVVTVVGGAFDVRVKSNLLTTSALTTLAGGIEQRRNLVNVYFNEDSLDPALAKDIRFYQLVDTNGSLATSDDRILVPTSLVYDALNHTATLDFGIPLANATYKLQVGESDENNNLLTTAVNVGTVFNTTPYEKVAFIGDAGGNIDYDLYKIQVNVGASITATVLPGTSLNSAVRLFNGAGSAIAFDNGGGIGVQDQILNFSPGVGGTYYVGVSNSLNTSYTANNTGTTAGGTTGSYRLMISTTAGISASDNNSSYALATQLGTLGAGGQAFLAAIDTTQSSTIPLPPPAGGSDEPGHREIPHEAHGGGAGTTPSAPGSLGTVTFQFPLTYGSNAQGDTLYNEITPEQKDRAREIFEIYASLYGFEVAESTTSGIAIVTGDPRAVQPTIPVGSIGGIAGGGIALMNSFLNFTAQDNQFGGSWMGIALHEIGHAVGLGHSYDIRSVQGNGTAGEDQYPGNNDIVHGRRISPNSGTDIDLYQFTVDQKGTFTAEVVAERLATSSLLNSALRLYRQDPNSTKTLLAQNDDYFSNDAFIELELTPGTYFIGVSSTGNTDYDPTISDTGFNGTSDGTYQLQLKLAPLGLASLQDLTGQGFDGNADRQPGGTYEFAFQSANTLYVDKSAMTNLAFPMTAIQTTIQVNDLTMFSSTPGFDIRIENELMRVTSIDTVNKIFGVDRTFNGTADNVIHGAGRAVRNANVENNLALSMTSSQTTVQVNDLTMFPSTPGFDIRIENEGSLALSMTAGQTTVQVNDLTMFPSTPGFDIRIENELMRVTSINTGTKVFGVDRAFNGTSDNVAHAFGQAVRTTEVLRVTSINTVTKVFGVDRTFNGTADNVTHAAGRVVRTTLENGSLANPYGLISLAVAAATPGTTIRVVGNGGADNDILTVQDNRPYLLGQNDSFVVLEDGSNLQIPRNVVLQVDAGAIVKAQGAIIDVGTSAVGIDRSGGALQVLGIPGQAVYLTTYETDLIGGDSDGVTDGSNAGDWGGLVFRNDSDFVASDAGTNSTDRGIFLNYVNHADISFGGGQVSVDSVVDVFAPIHLVTARPTVSFNRITNSLGAAMSGDPDSFDDSRRRIGPDLHGNLLTDNSLNGMFIRIVTPFGQPINRLTKTARFDDTDIVYLITENLEMVGNPGGPLDGVARPSGRLAIDPGVVVKMSGSRIEAMRGNSHLIAEGTSVDPVIFTSVNDDRFGSGGTFDTGNNQSTVLAAAGNWGGLMFNAVSRGSIDHAIIAYAGGNIPIEGGLANFNAIEAHHGAKLRVANSTFENNADGTGTGGTRNGRGTNGFATIFVRQAQPIIVNNVFQNNGGVVVNINASAMLATFQHDSGRSTGAIDDFEQFADNHGPLVRLNRMTGNAINGMEVRGDILTTESVWDDTDIVHVLKNEIKVDQHHTYSGIRLQSSPGESLIVKLLGASAGFTADGILLDIDDRIGGTVQIVGQPGFPVVLTSLSDDSVGASFDPSGFPQTDTNNNGSASAPAAGDWRSLQFLKNSNDRNVRVERESELASNGGIELNDNQGNAQFLGELAPQHVNSPTADPLGQTVRLDGDDNRPLGFEVHGFISADDPGDVDVYSFKATTGTEIWIDLDRTRSASLDPVIELVQSDGTVLGSARYNSGTRTIDLTGNAAPLAKFAYNGGDFYSFNYHDTGFRVTLAGTPGAVGTYFVRVRSNQASAAALNTLDGGLTRGEYQLQIRLRQVDEKPGSVVRFADIRYAVTGIEVAGLPAHSPLLSEGTETTTANGSNQTPQPLGNLLNSDLNTISVGGELGGADDIDFYQYNSDYAATVLGNSIQVIGGLSGGGKTWSTVFDLDYSDGLTRGDTTMIIYNASGIPILIGRESQVQDDQPGAGQASDLDDLTRGSVGKLDPFIGPVQMPTGNPGSTTNYLVAVSSNRFLNNQLDQNYDASPNNMLARLEPVNSVTRIIEDHIGYQGYGSNAQQVDPSNTTGLFDITSATSLATYVRPFDLGDVVLYVNRADSLATVNPLFGQVTTTIDNDLDQTNNNNGATDIVMRSDGRLFTYRRSNTNNGVNTNNSTSGALVELETGTTSTNLGNFISNTNDGIPSGTPAAGNFGNDVFEQVTNSDDVDALAFQRNGPGNYALYYSVRENGVFNGGATSFNSKLYRADPNSGSAALGNPIGIQGDIQLAGTNPASQSGFFADGTNSGSLSFQTRAQGTQANGVQLIINSPSQNAGLSVSAFGSVVVVQTGFTVSGSTITYSHSIQQVADAINAHFGAQQIITAVVSNGAAGTLVTFGTTLTAAGGTNAVSGRIQGNVTGLAFGSFTGGTLYGVTSGEGSAVRGSQLVRITPGFGGGGGTATIIRDFTSQGIGTNGFNGFQGLSLGPQNVSGGIYANTLFAVTADGSLVAFDTSGNDVTAFDTNGDGLPDNSVIATGFNSPTGLAFSPLDFNLWHPTITRSSDSGHGINAAYDNSRTPSAESRTYSDGSAGSPDDTLSEKAGAVSFYFGLDEYVDSNSNPYLNYEDSRTQLGVLNREVQRDLTSTAAIGANYNLPGGAYGSLVTNTFNLTSSTGTQTNRDRPTMYFNYFLASEDVNRNSADSFMRDSARVFISTTGGNTWELLTTNDSPLGGTGIPSGGLSTETPHFVSSSRLANNSDARQRVQTMFDNTGSWRQARVDLSDYSGRAGLVLRFDFSTAGTVIDAGLTNNDPTLATPQDGYGDLESSGRSTNNNFEGFYIDDIIIGWSERGEMITGVATADQTYFSVPQPPAALNLPEEILSGPYQVEIRRGFEYGANIDKKTPLIAVTNTFDTNSRFIPGYDLLAASPPVSDNFNSPATTFPTFNPANGWLALSPGANAPWITAPLFGTGLSQAAISTRVDDSEFSAMQITQTASAVSFNYKVTADIGDQFRVYLDDINDLGGPMFTSGDTAGVFQSKSLSLPAGVHTLIFVYQKDGSDGVDAVSNANERAIIDDVVFTGLSNTFIRGDRNFAREQGHFQIESNIIRNSSTFGIDVAAGPRAAGTNFSTPGSPINFQTQNAERLAPSVTIVNNAVANSGTVGIRFGGDPNSAGSATNPASAVPFGKIVNNTIYGTAARTGTGIQVHDFASPTLMNNIVANTATAVSIDGTSSTTVRTRMFYHDNQAIGVGVGASDINDPAANPLFVNPTTFNFYLKSGAQAIDRSLGSLSDRSNFVALKAQSAIPNSDVFSPSKDLYGQKRVDDPSQAPSGFGGEVFNDLGAIERGDQTGGVTKLIVPEDGGVDDLNSLPAVVHINSPLFFNEFRIKFTDAGIGIEDSSVNPNGSQFTLMQATGASGGTFVTLQNNVDYIFAYNANTNEAILTSVTLFPSDARFTLTVDNSSATGVKDVAGNNLVPNQSNGTVRFDILVTSPPTITDIVDQSTFLGAPFKPIPFTIGDGQTPAGNLTVDVTSSNTAFVPNANIVVGGSGANRTLSITPTANLLGTTTITITVTDADGNTASDTFDATVIQYGLSISDVNVAEGAGSAVFTVSLPAPSSQTVTVNYATANGSALGSDFSATSGSLTFSPGETSKTVNVLINDDSLFELTETFLVNLSGATKVSIVDGQGQGIIADDDVAPIPTLSLNNVTVVEGTSGTQNAVFTVTLSTASLQTVTVDFVTADGLAIAGADFNTTSGSLTFSPGQTTQTITVAITGDAMDEANENYFVNLSGAINANISDDQGQGTITDDDLAPSLSIGDVMVTEGTGSNIDAIFTVSLSAASSLPVTVQYKTTISTTTTIAYSTAQSPTDYSASGLLTLTIPAGQTSQTIAVSVVGDAFDELNETFFLVLSSATNASIADSQGVGTILDDDLAPTLVISDVTVTEGNSKVGGKALFTVSLSEVSGLPVTVTYASAGNTAAGSSDFLNKSGTLGFAPGVLSQVLTYQVIGDTLDELDETFFINFTKPVNVTLVDSQGVGTIIDDDAAPTLSITTKTVTEGTGNVVNAVFTVKLLTAANALTASGLPVSFDYATTDNSATSPADYTSTTGTLTFNPGEKTKTIVVPVVGDALDELLNETFFLNLTNPTNATLAITQISGTIKDNDATPKLSINSVTVTEGPAAGTVNMDFTVTLSAPSGLSVTVDYTTANGTAIAGSDYNSTNGSLTFNPGETTKTITVTILGNAVPQSKRLFNLNLNNALNALFGSSKGIGTILDDD